ncbi:hypothetical protein BYT27DRAFT_7185421 [Phlegmacium glaucopus]|nr:hypothetical protein BYT27DRAFT_7190274 [Phlegmacium glaucopus]KAF8810873.1 hypothetical protein BYT27DRAFT_7185421 [Phlegmacium glaucopus]
MAAGHFVVAVVGTVHILLPSSSQSLLLTLPKFAGAKTLDSDFPLYYLLQHSARKIKQFHPMLYPNSSWLPHHCSHRAFPDTFVDWALAGGLTW